MVKRLNFFNAVNSAVLGDPKITLAELTYPKDGVDCLAPYFFFCVCVCVYVCGCMCALTAAHLWGHLYEYTPAKWGLFKLWGHFRVPAKKSS